MNGQQMEDEEEEDEIDIANQYGMYYSVFANKGGQGGISNYKQQNGSGDSSNGPTGLVNSGYLMPFNPS
jgi:Myb-like DNA-binding protein BAS1